MRISKRSDEELARRAQSHRKIGGHLADLLEELVDRRAAEKSYARSLERSFAYTHAASLIETECLEAVTGPDNPSAYDGEFENFRDLKSSAVELDDVIEYLDSRRLLLHHETMPHLVVILDEDEPLAEVPGVIAHLDTGAAE